ncbi:MAG: PDZ domain-containing protein [Luteolibacter sp.]
MKYFTLIALLSTTLAHAADPTPLPAVQTAARVWLGLHVSKPDATLTAQLPSLPPGIGFIIRSIDAGGPAAAAGLREFDILWKLGDQMLVNEAQLAALLRLHQPGDAIALSGFRAGKPLEVTLKLGTAPAATPPFPGELVDSVILPGGCGGPMRVVNRAEQSARYSTADGRAPVRRENSIYHVDIRDSANQPVYQGQITSRDQLDAVPCEWRRRVSALCRGLDHVLDGHLTVPRQPRPRVVPPAATNSR